MPSTSMALVFARGAAIFSLCAVLISPPLVNASLAICLLAFVVARPARERLAAILRQPIVIATAVMAGSIAIGMAYGAGSLASRFGELYHNRFWLLIPIFAALFADSDAKRQAALSFALFCGLTALLAIVFWWAGYSPRHNPPGILLRDHVTQGMGFSLGAFIGALLLTHLKAQFGRTTRWLLVASVVLSVVGVLQVSTGRSGHVALGVLTLVLVAGLARNPARRRLAFATAALVLIGFLSSGVVRDRFKLGMVEATTTETQTEMTSMGLRVVFWANSLELVRQRPLLGHGTGGFAASYAEQVKGDQSWRGTRTDDPHNQYLLTLAERGIPGILALLVSMVLLLRQRDVGEPWGTVGLGVVLTWAATNVVNSHFHTFNQGHQFAMLVGCFLAPLAAKGVVGRGVEGSV